MIFQIRSLSAGQRKGETMRILIAEDEVEIARALKVLLEKNKCTADIVHNGKDVWDYICQSHYDVIVRIQVQPVSM